MGSPILKLDHRLSLGGPTPDHIASVEFSRHRETLPLSPAHALKPAIRPLILAVVCCLVAGCGAQAPQTTPPAESAAIIQDEVRPNGKSAGVKPTIPKKP